MPAAARACGCAAVPLEAGALLRAGRLEGASIVVAATRDAAIGAAVAQACAALGASVAPWAGPARGGRGRGGGTRGRGVAAVVASRASPAGAYFSGCLLDLRGVRPDG